MTTTSTTNPVTVTPADVLRKAADYLLDHGWIQDDFYEGDGPSPAACLAGAIGIVATGQRIESEHELNPDDFINDPLASQAARVMGTALTHTYGMGIVEWNDRPGQRAAIVVDHLHRVADAWDAHHTHDGEHRA